MIMTGMEFYFTPKGEVMIIDECGIGSFYPNSYLDW